VLQVELDDRREAEKTAVAGADREAGAAPVVPSSLVPLDPAADESLVGAGGNAGEPNDVRVLAQGEQLRRVRLRQRLQGERVVLQRRVGPG
jgi:hypothetical protein